MIRRIYTKKVKKSIAKSVAFLLVVLCIAGTSRLELLHLYFHEHEILVTHSEEQEKDPCHKLIYHNDTQACDHDSHVTASDKCQTCDLASQSDPTMLIDIYFVSGQFANSYFEFYKLSIDSYWCVLSSSRAPPTIS